MSSCMITAWGALLEMLEVSCPLLVLGRGMAWSSTDLVLRSFAGMRIRPSHLLGGGRLSILACKSIAVCCGGILSDLMDFLIVIVSSISLYSRSR